MHWRVDPDHLQLTLTLRGSSDAKHSKDPQVERLAGFLFSRIIAARFSFVVSMCSPLISVLRAGGGFLALTE
jgi:hypothetical protein